MTKKNPWTEQEDLTLKQLIQEGKSTRDIARVITTHTNNSIRGRAIALDLSIQRTPPAPNSKPSVLDSLQHAEEAKSLEKPVFGRLPISCLDSSGWTRVGLVADTPLCSKEERLEAPPPQYEMG